MLTNADEYFIDVVSNASMEIYPNNSLSNFINKLPQTLKLSGEWLVGVQEVFYPLSFKTTSKTVGFTIIYHEFKTGVKITGANSSITFDETDTVDSILQNLNAELVKLMMKDEAEQPSEVLATAEAPRFYLEDEKVLVARGTSVLAVMIPAFHDKYFYRLLGFEELDYNRQFIAVLNSQAIACRALMTYDFRTKSHLLFVYTDIIHEHFVGDANARVLRVVPLHKTKNESLGHIFYSKPY